MPQQIDDVGAGELLHQLAQTGAEAGKCRNRFEQRKQDGGTHGRDATGKAFDGFQKAGRTQPRQGC